MASLESKLGMVT